MSDNLLNIIAELRNEVASLKAQVGVSNAAFGREERIELHDMGQTVEGLKKQVETLGAQIKNAPKPQNFQPAIIAAIEPIADEIIAERKFTKQHVEAEISQSLGRIQNDVTAAKAAAASTGVTGLKSLLAAANAILEEVQL